MVLRRPVAIVAVLCASSCPRASARNEERRCVTAGGAYSGVVVTSPGGAGTTSLMAHLMEAGVPLNSKGDKDHLKHGLPDGCGTGALRTARPPPPGGWRAAVDEKTARVVGPRPLVIFLYDDPAASVLAMTRKGWLAHQAAKLASAPSCPSFLPREFRGVANASCVAETKAAHGRKPASSAAVARGCPPGGNATKKGPCGAALECAERGAVEALEPFRDACDLTGQERHWHQWVARACDPRSGDVLFARASTLGDHWRDLAGLLALGPPDCLPSGLCETCEPEHAGGDGSGASRWLQRCRDGTFRDLIASQRLMGDFRVVRGPDDPVCRSIKAPPAAQEPCCFSGASPRKRAKNGSRGSGQRADRGGPSKPPRFEAVSL